MERGTANFLRVLSLLVLATVVAAEVTLAPGKAPLNSKDPVQYRDCGELWKAGYNVSGVHVLYMNKTSPFLIRCEFTKDNAYNIIQQRVDGSVNFAQPLAMYIRGFGTAATDYWAGLDNINHLTMTMSNSVLTISLYDWGSNHIFAHYSYFKVYPYAYRYQMFVSGYQGTAPDDFSYQNAMEFKTYDHPDPNNCAINMRGGWWYNYCAYSFLNGHYYLGHYTPTGGYYDGIYWKDWTGYSYSLKTVTMAVSRT